MALAVAAPPAPVSATGPVGSKRRDPKPRLAARPKLGPVGARHTRPAQPAPARLTRRGVVLTRVASLLAFAIMVFGFVHALAPAAPSSVGAEVVTVGSGESLWTVAERVNPDVDPRVTVTAIRELNGMRGSAVVEPGERLTVPVFGAGS